MSIRQAVRFGKYKQDLKVDNSSYFLNDGSGSVAVKVKDDMIYFAGLLNGTAVCLCIAAIFKPSIISAQNAPTITYNIATESNAGMDGCMAWQSAFLLNDGRIVSFGTGNHAPEQSNAMRIIDPVTTPGSVLSYDDFPWTQNITPPDMHSGSNRYVSNYDNHPSIYVPSANKAIWAGHGVYDFAQKIWTYGDRAPCTQAWTAFCSDPQGGMSSTYNPAAAWCASLNIGVWFGASDGGYGRQSTDLSLIVPGTSTSWTITVTNLASQGVQGLHYARDMAVCIGNFFYVAGPLESGGGSRFYKIDLSTKTLAATLASPPSSESFAQMVYDSRRARIVLVGHKVQEYNLSTDAWADVTPANYPGYSYVNGIYHPTLDAIYFRGIAQNTVTCMAWHKMTFPGGGTGCVPAFPESGARPFFNVSHNPDGGALISIRLDAATLLNLDIYDISGRHVQTITSGAFKAETRSFAWDCVDRLNRSARGGMYVARLTTPNSAGRPSGVDGRRRIQEIIGQ
jgi:hypothetical protein